VHAAALRLELRIPAARSLKEKRRILKALSATLSNSFPVAVSEVGFQDQWQRATLGVALVAAQAGQLERVIHALTRVLREHPDVELLEMGVSYLEEG
jgi:uncharacterized protein YlxP (DUF503 family)